MAEQTVDVATTNEGQVRTSREGTREQERFVAPPVDIYETQEELVVMADLPGVSKDHLNIRVDGGLLSIQGKSMHTIRGDLLHGEYQLVDFFRQFELSEAVNQGKIAAELKHGVLTLHLPKAEKAKPRQVEIKVG